MEPDNNTHALAGASDPGTSKADIPSEPREIFPVMFDKDYLDFRPEEVSEEELAPKGYSALEHASEQKFSDDLIPSLEIESESSEVPETEKTEVQMNVPPTVETAS